MKTDISDEERARRQAYYRANRERILAQAKAWRAANPERYRELQQAHYLANRETYKAQRAVTKARREPERAARREATTAPSVLD